MARSSRQLARWELDGVGGAVVVIDVIRAFTTAAYAFGAGASAIYLVGSVADALDFKDRHPGALALGEDRGLRPDGFDFPNSPVMVGRADLGGRTLVQRTSAGTQGALAAHHAERLWVASLACASATARAVDAAGLGAPTYVITGRFPDRPERSGADDVIAADTIERLRLGRPVDPTAVATELLGTAEAARTLRLGPEHCDPDDIRVASRLDVFDFAMEVERSADGLRVTASVP